MVIKYIKTYLYGKKEKDINLKNCKPLKSLHWIPICTVMCKSGYGFNRECLHIYIMYFMGNLLTVLIVDK